MIPHTVCFVLFTLQIASRKLFPSTRTCFPWHQHHRRRQRQRHQQTTYISFPHQSSLIPWIRIFYCGTSACKSSRTTWAHLSACYTPCSASSTHRPHLSSFVWQSLPLSAVLQLTCHIILLWLFAVSTARRSPSKCSHYHRQTLRRWTRPSHRLHQRKSRMEDWRRFMWP